MSRPGSLDAAAAVPDVRFHATVLQQYTPVAADPMTIVLSILEWHHTLPDGEQESFDAAVSEVPPAFFMELVDRAIHRCLTYMAVDGHDGTDLVMRRMACLLRSMHIDDDVDVWYYIGYGLFGYTITAAYTMLQEPDGDIDAEIESPDRIVRFVDRVSRRLLNGIFRSCMRNPERCMHRLTWSALLATLVRQLEIHGQEEDEEDEERASAHRRRAIPFLDQSEWETLRDLIFAIDSTDIHLERAWDAPFVHQAARNTRNAIDAQNVLGTPGRTNEARARLPADLATHLAHFLAPASVPASELARQQAAYASSADRHRAHTDVDRAMAAVRLAHERHQAAEQRHEERQQAWWQQRRSMRAVQEALLAQQERDRVYAQEHHAIDEEEEKESDRATRQRTHSRFALAQQPW